MDNKNELILWASTKIGLPFIWGESDCTTIVIEGIKLYYNEEFLFTKKWKSLKDAIRTFKEYGNPGFILESKGFFKVKKNFEQTGDIFIWEGRSYYLLGFVINGEVMVADENKILEMRPISSFKDYFCYRK